MVIIKVASTTEDWQLFDNKRLGYNGENRRFAPSANSSESTGDNRMDLLSNGFKIKSNADAFGGAQTYVYMAWAEAPFVNSNGVPGTAR